MKILGTRESISVEMNHECDIGDEPFSRTVIYKDRFMPLVVEA